MGCHWWPFLGDYPAIWSVCRCPVETELQWDPAVAGLCLPALPRDVLQLARRLVCQARHRAPVRTVAQLRQVTTVTAALAVDLSVKETRQISYCCERLVFTGFDDHGEHFLHWLSWWHSWYWKVWLTDSMQLSAISRVPFATNDLKFLSTRYWNWTGEIILKCCK